MVIELFFAFKLSMRVGEGWSAPEPGTGALRFRTVMLFGVTGPARIPPPAAALTVAIDSDGGGAAADDNGDCPRVDFIAVGVRVEKGRFKLGATVMSCDVLTTMFGPGRTFRTAVPAPPPMVFVMTRSCLRPRFPLRNDMAAALLVPAPEAAATVLDGGLLIAIR